MLGAAEGFVEVHARRIAHQGRDAVNIGDAGMHILEAFGISFRVGGQINARLRRR